MSRIPFNNQNSKVTRSVRAFVRFLKGANAKAKSSSESECEQSARFDFTVCLAVPQNTRSREITPVEFGNNFSRDWSISDEMNH